MNTIKKLVLAAVLAGMGMCCVLPAWASKAKAMIDPLQSLSIGVGSTDACLSKCLSQVPAEQLEVRQKELDGLRNSIRGAMRTYPAQAQYLAIAGNAMMERVVAYDYTYHSQQTSALSQFFDHVVAAVNLANAAPSGICEAAAMVFKHYDCQEPENAKRLTDAFDVFVTAVGEVSPVVVDEIGLMGTTLIDSTRRNFEFANVINEAFSNVVESVGHGNQFRAQTLCAVGCSLLGDVAREPSANGQLLAAYSNVVESVAGRTTAQLRALGETGKAMMDAIARQTDAIGSIRFAYSNVWESVEGRTDAQAQALWLTGKGLMDAIARQPEASGRIVGAYSNVWESVVGRADAQALALGETGKSMMDAVARQPEVSGMIIAAYSNVWESVVDSTDAQARALGQTGKGMMDAIARQPEYSERIIQVYSNAWKFVATIADNKVQTLGETGLGLMDAMGRRTDLMEAYCQTFSNVVESVSKHNDAQAQVLCAMGKGCLTAMSSQYWEDPNPAAVAVLLDVYTNAVEVVGYIEDERVRELTETGVLMMQVIGNQPEQADYFLNDVFTYEMKMIARETETLVQAQALGAAGKAWMDAVARSADIKNECSSIFDGVVECVEGCSDAWAQSLGMIGAQEFATLLAQPDSRYFDVISRSFSEVSRDCQSDAVAQAWGKICVAFLKTMANDPNFFLNRGDEWLKIMAERFRKGCTDIEAAAVAEPLAAMMAAGENQSVGKALEQLKYPEDVFNIVQGLDERRAMAVGKACAGAINAIAKTDGFALNYVQKPLDVLRQTAVSTPSRVAEGIGLAGYGVMSAFSADSGRFNIQMGLLGDNLSWITSESQMMRLVSVKSPRPEGVWNGTAEVVVELRWILDGVPYALDAALQAGGEGGAKVYELVSPTDGVYTQVMSRAELFGEASTVQDPAANLTLKLIEQVPGRASETVRQEYATFPFGNYLTLTVPSVENAVYDIFANGETMLSGVSAGGTYTVNADAPVRVTYAPVDYGKCADGKTNWSKTYSTEELKVEAIVLEKSTVQDGLGEIVPNPVEYYAWDAKQKKLVPQMCEVYRNLTPDMATLESGWYVVTGKVERVTEVDDCVLAVNGEVHLILMDDEADLNAKGRPTGIGITAGNSLAVYGQGKGTGRLTAEGASHQAAILCAEGAKLTINGGVVAASDTWYYGTGIGAFNSGMGDVVINGGKVSAAGGTEYSAGIGSDKGSGSLTINGGEVFVSCRSSLNPCVRVGKFAFGESYVGGVLINDNRIVSGAEYAKKPFGKTAQMPVSGIALPQVEGLICTVSNATEQVSPVIADGVMSYCATNHSMLTVYFSLEPSYNYVDVPDKNPMVFADVTSAIVMPDKDVPQTYQTPIEYLEWDRTQAKLVTKVCEHYKVVTPSLRDYKSGWYVVMDDVSLTEGITVQGTPADPTHLILCDGKTLTLTGNGNRGVGVGGGNAICIYGQQDGSGMLNAASSNINYSSAAIGGMQNDKCGMINLNGGTIVALSKYAEAIGKGKRGTMAGSVNLSEGFLWQVSVGMNGHDEQTVSVEEYMLDHHWKYARLVAKPTTFVTAQPFNVTSQRDNGSFIVFPPMDAELEEGECWVAMPLSMRAREEIYDWNTGRTYEQAFIDEAYDFVAGDEPVVAGSRSIESLRAIVSRFYGYETFVGNDPYQIYFGEANAIALLKCRRAKNGELMVLTVGLVDGLQEMANGEARPNEILTAVRTTYYAWNDETRRIEGPFFARAMPLFEGTRTLRDGRWYVALSGKDKFETLTVSGDAHLILEDGCDIDLLPRYEGTGIMPGLRLLTPTSPEDLTFSSISIYGQKEGTGKLSARGDAGAAGIGTGPDEYGQTTINIHGGQITARGGKKGGAAIGTGINCRGFFYDDSSFPSTLAVNIYGGTVVANPERGSGGPGIGFGNRSTLPQVALKVLGGDVTCMCGAGERAFAIGWGWDCGLYRGDPYDCDYLRFALGRGMGLWAGKDSAEGTFLRFSPAAYDQMIRDHANLPYAHIMPAPPLSVDIASPDWRLFTYEVLTNGAPMEVAGRGDLHLDLPGVTEVEVVYTVADGYQIEEKQTWTKFIGVKDLEGESTFTVEPPMPAKVHVIARQNFELVRNADSSFALKLSADNVSPLVDDERWIVITDAASATGLFDDIWAEAEPMIGTRRTDEVMIGSWVEKVKALGGTIQCFEAADAVLHLDSTVGNLMVFRATRATGDGTIMTVGGERNLQAMTAGGDEVRTGSMDAEYIKPLLNAEVYGQRTNESDEYGYQIFDLLLGLKNETQPEGEVYFWVAFRRLDGSDFDGETRDAVESRRATVRRIAASVMDMPVGRFESNLGSIYPRFENAERDFYAATGKIASFGEFPAMLPRDTEEVFVFRTRLGEKGEQDAKVVAIGDCTGIRNDELRWVNRLAGATVTIPYYAWDEAAGKVVEQPPVEAIPLPESEDSGEVVLHGNRWYVVVGNRHLNRDCLRVDVGTAHLILADGASLEVRGGVTVDQDATLAIYSEKEVSHDMDRYKQSRMIITSTDGWAGRRDEPGVFGGALEIHGGCFEGYGGKAATIRNRRLTFYGGDLWIDGYEVGGSVISSRTIDIRGGYVDAYARYQEGYFGGYPLNVIAGEQDGYLCELNVGRGSFVSLYHEGIESAPGSSAIGDTLDVNLADGVYVWTGEWRSEMQLSSLPIYRARPKRKLAFNPSMEKLREQDFEITAVYDDNLKTNGFTLKLPAEELRPGEKWCVIGFDEGVTRLTADEFGGVSVGDALMLEFAVLVSVEATIIGDEAFARRFMDEGIEGFKGCFTALTDESTIAIPSDKAVDLVLLARVIDTIDLPVVTLGAAKELQSMADGETAGCGLEFLQKQEFSLSRNADGSFTVTLPEGDVLKPGESWAWAAMPVGVGDDDEVTEMLKTRFGAGLPAGVLSFDMFMDEEASGEILACGATTERTITLPAGAAAVLVGRTRPGVSMEDGPCEYLALSFGMASHLNVPGYKDWPRHDELFPNASDYCTVTIPEVDKAALIIAVDGTELGYRPDGVYTVRKGSNVRIEVLLADPENYELRSPAVLAYDYIQNDVTVGPGDVVVVAKSAPTPVADQGFVVRRGEDGALTVDMSGEAPLGPGELWVCLTIDKGGCDLPDMESEGGLFGDIIWRDAMGVLDDVNAGELPLDLFMVVPGAEGVVVSTNETFAIPSDSEMALVARAYDGYNGKVGGNRYYGLSMGGVRFLTTLQPGDEVEGERWNEEHQVRYSAWDGTQVVHGLVTNALPLTAAAFDANGILSVTSNSFYAVTGKVRGEFTRLGIDVAEGVTLSLLVKDGSRLELGFIHLPPTATLNVYGQDNGSGTLTFPSASMNRAAIGGALGDAGCGTINFHGPQLTIGSLFLSQEKGTPLTSGKIQVDAYAVIGGNLNRDTESSGALNVYRGIVDVMGQAGCAIGGYKPMQVNVRGGKIIVRDGAIGGMNLSSRASGITLGAGYKLQCQREEETVELTVAEYDKLLADGNPPSGVRIVRPATVAFDAEIAQLAQDGKLTMMVRAAGGSKAGLKTVEPIWTADGGTYPIECGDGVYVIAHANGTESIRRPDVMTFGIATGDVAVAFADLNWHEPELVAEQKFEAYRCLDGRVRLTPKGRLAEGEAWLWIALPDYVAKQSAMGGLTIAEMFAQQLKGAVDSKICYVGGVRDAGSGPVVEPMLRPLYNCVQGNMFLPTDGFHWGVSREKKVFYAPADTEFAAVCKVYDAGIAQMMFASDKQSAPAEAAEAAEAAAEAAEAEAQPMLKAVAAVGAQAASASGINVNKDLFLTVGCRYTAQTAGSVQNLQALPRLPEYEPGDERNPWPLGPEDAEEPVAYTNDTNTLVIEGKGPFAEPTKKPWLEEGVGPITEIVIKDPETELPDDIFEGLGTPEPIGVDLPDGWPADDLPVPGQPWHGGYVKIEEGHWPLTISNVKFQQRYPWNGLVDITFDLTGSTNVELGVWAKSGSTTIAASNFVGRTDMMFAVESQKTVKLVWDADKDALPGDLTKLVLENVTITVGTGKGGAETVIGTYDVNNTDPYRETGMGFALPREPLEGLAVGDEFVFTIFDNGYNEQDQIFRLQFGGGQTRKEQVLAQELPTRSKEDQSGVILFEHREFRDGMQEIVVPVTEAIVLGVRSGRAINTYLTHMSLRFVSISVRHGSAAVGAESAAGLIDLAKGTRVARDIENIVIDPKWGEAATASVLWPKTETAREYDAATVDTWNTARLPAGKYEFAYSAGSTDYTAAFWLAADNWTVIDHETITGERPVTGEKVLVAGESVIKQGGKLVIAGEPEIIWDGAFKVEKGGRIYAPYFDVVVDPATGLVTLVPKDRPTVTGLRFSQRYPWNGLVDVFFTATYAKDPAAKVWVKLAAKLDGEEKQVKTLYLANDAATTNTQFQVAQGEVHLIWDTMKDVGLKNYGELEITAQAALVRMAEEAQPVEEDKMLCFTPVANPRGGEIDTVYFRFERVISQDVPFIIKSDAGGSAVAEQVTAKGEATPLDIQYSYDRKRWSTYDGETIEIPVGQKLYLRGNNPNGLSSYEEYVNIKPESGYFAASGSVMSLIDGKGEATVIPCEYCFYRLFYQCPALTQAPDLTAATLKRDCYLEMFADGSLVDKIKILATGDPDLLEDAIMDAVNGIRLKATGTLVLDSSWKDFGLPSSYKNWRITFTDAGNPGGGPEPLCFTPLKGAGSIRVVNEGKSKLYVEYSIDGVKWIPFDPLKPMEIKCGDGQSIYLRGKNPNGLTTDPEIGFFHITTDSPFGVSGDVMSLIDYEKKVTEIPCDYCFYHLFEKADIRSAPELPATVLKPGCYEGMFMNTALTKGPTLPALEVPVVAYEEMFSGCSMLESLQVECVEADSSKSFYHWLNDVAAEGFIYSTQSTSFDLLDSYNAIPKGWKFQRLKTPMPKSEELKVESAPAEGESAAGSATAEAK